MLVEINDTNKIKIMMITIFFSLLIPDYINLLYLNISSGNINNFYFLFLLKSNEIELIQNLFPVGFGPSSKT